jgi:cell division protein FtsQ
VKADLKKSLRIKIETRKNRLKRRSGKIFREMWKVVLLTAAITVTASLLIYTYTFIVSSPYFRLKETVVRGTERLSQEEIIELAEIKPDQNILLTNLKSMARKIQAHPWVKDVAVQRELPDRLAIIVTERKAVALIKKEDSLYYMERDGSVFVKLEKRDKTDLPVLTGFSRKDEDAGDLLRQSLDLLEYIASYNDIPAIKNISEIHGDPLFGFSLFTDSGLCIQMGFGDFDGKLKRMKPVLVELSKKNWNGFLVIDLNDPNKITVQGKQIPVPMKMGRGVRA